MYYCTCCDTVYDTEAYVALKTHRYVYSDGLVKCPNIKCEGSLIDIDENFISLMHELNELGVNTMYCCSGHYWDIKDNLLCIYICYDYETDIEETGFTKEFTNQLLKMSKTDEYSFLRIDIDSLPEEKTQAYDCLYGYECYTNTKVSIYMDIKDIYEDKLILKRNAKLLRKQAEFIETINIAIDRTLQVLAEEDINS